MTGLTMGSLFDGSGGFPLGALLNGIQPVWASEIEPFPIRVTTRRLPFMKHYGNICKIDGAVIEPVDISLWHRVFEEHRINMGRSSKQKSRKQIVKWLNNPSSDYAEYRMWGNGVALPCVCFVMAGINWLTDQSKFIT